MVLRLLIVLFMLKCACAMVLPSYYDDSYINSSSMNQKQTPGKPSYELNLLFNSLPPISFTLEDEQNREMQFARNVEVLNDLIASIKSRSTRDYCDNCPKLFDFDKCLFCKHKTQHKKDS